MAYCCPQTPSGGTTSCLLMLPATSYRVGSGHQAFLLKRAGPPAAGKICPPRLALLSLLAPPAAGFRCATTTSASPWCR